MAGMSGTAEIVPAPLGRACRVGGWACLVAVTVLSLLPAEDMVRTGAGGAAEHAAAYAGTALLAGLGARGMAAWPAAGAWLLGGLVAWAGLMELLQNFSPGRTPGWDGWLASALGAALGFALARGARQRLRRMRAAA